MIKYNLICKCGKTFESWFSGSTEYDSLKKKKLINCIYCDSTSVKKTVMAPNLYSKSNKPSNKNKLEKDIKKQLLELNMLTNGEQLAIGMEEKNRLSFKYEQDIMNVQGKIFDNKDEELLFPVWEFALGYPPDLFQRLKNEELIISVVSGFAGSMIYYTFNSGTFSHPSLAGTNFLSAYKEVFLEGLKDPEGPFSGKIMFELIQQLLKQIRSS